MGRIRRDRGDIGNGTYSFSLTSMSANSAFYNSKEALQISRNWSSSRAALWQPSAAHSSNRSQYHSGS